MTPRLALRVDLLAWLVFGATWLIAAAWVKRDKRVDGLAARAVQLVLHVAGVALLFVRPWALVDRAPWRLLPDPALRAWLSATLTPLGIALAVAARVALGRNWSGRVTLKEGHELVERGPYRLVRHPIYTGLLLALAGTALLQAQAVDLAGVAVFAVAFALKMRAEDHLLAAEFGEAFARYRQRVGALVPFLR